MAPRLTKADIGKHRWRRRFAWWPTRLDDGAAGHPEYIWLDDYWQRDEVIDACGSDGFGGMCSWLEWRRVKRQAYAPAPRGTA